MLWALALILGCLAALEDLRHRKIPNWITIGALGAAVLYQTLHQGWAGLAAASTGTVIGFAVFWVFYCLGAMGGSDIKLMAAFGALLGPSGIMMAALLAAVIGGVVAAAAIAFNRRRAFPIPYAPAIVLGAWLALLGKG
jgi:prepilin peptidase CpaA